VSKNIDFDCSVSEPMDIIVTLTDNKYDPEQEVCIVHITNEGLLLDFYTDGELVRTTGRTWQEWFDSCPAGEPTV
jgi:hypothetical protein